MTALDDVIAAAPQPVKTGLGVVGALFLASKVFSFLSLALNTFVLPGTNLRKYGGKGTWAVVTGASDGLGKEFALNLASKGFNIVLVSRTLSKLQTFAQELETKYPGVQTKVLDIDFSADNDEDYVRLEKIIDGLDIGILLNNVGQSHSIPVPFTLTEKKELQDIITINCIGTLKVTSTIAPRMESRKRGLILTMGSFGGWMPSPLLATYSGSKAFLQHWSTALASELKPKGVDVQLCLSYLVVSAMSKVRKPSALIPSAKSFVRAALGKVGSGSWQQTAYTYTPYWSHALLGWVIENTLGTGHAYLVWYNQKMHEDIRRRALKKQAREAAKQAKDN